LVRFVVCMADCLAAEDLSILWILDLPLNLHEAVVF
jgi:hypothetical protein